jgi:hypothetical protein
VTAQDKQADEHDQKQGRVEKHCGDESEHAGLDLDRLTGELCRVPCKAKLRMG